MFTREELLTILKTTTDKVIIKKLKDMLFVDEELIDIIKKEFEQKQLVKIEKSDNSNEYYIHFIVAKDDEYSYIEKAVEISMRYVISNQHYIMPEIRVIEHEGIDKMWWHGDMAQVYTRKDAAEYWNKTVAN